MKKFESTNGVLSAKVATVSKSITGKTRELTNDEVNEIQSSGYWFDGWFNGPKGEQIVITLNSKGKPALKRI